MKKVRFALLILVLFLACTGCLSHSEQIEKAISEFPDANIYLVQGSSYMFVVLKTDGTASLEYFFATGTRATHYLFPLNSIVIDK